MLGFGDLHQIANFAGMIHPHFKDGHLRLAWQAKNRKRQADVVIEVTDRFANIETHTEKTGDDIFLPVLPALPVTATMGFAHRRRRPTGKVLDRL